jgi:hypothetical protein
MPDKDLTNLPILDDIILPGDTNKAVHDNSSRVQNSHWNNNDTEKMEALQTDDSAGMDTETPEDIQLALEQPAEDQFNIEDIDIQETSPTAAAPVQIPSDTPTFTDATEETPNRQTSAATNVQDIEALTQEVMGNVMPELERHIRKIIRQTLQQHLPGKIDTD